MRHLLKPAMILGATAFSMTESAQDLPSRTIIQSAELLQDNTWTTSGSPYEVFGGVKVLDGVTLTIEAGV